MKRFTLLIAVLISQVCYTATDQIRRHELKNHSLLTKSNSNMYNADSEYSRDSGNKFIDTLKGVLILTLKSLNRYNNDLAIYFVQHHPFLAKTYNQLSNPNKSYPPKQQQVSPNNIGSLKTMSIRLSEFQRIPPRNKESMLSAEFKSNNVKATKIVADDVIVKQNGHRNTAMNRQNDNHRNSNKNSPQQASFSFNKKEPGSQFKFASWRSGNRRQTISNNADQQLRDSYRQRRHYFPSRQISPTTLSRLMVSGSKPHILAPIEKTYSKHKFKYPASALSFKTGPNFSQKMHISQNKIEHKHITSKDKELEDLWNDSWSDSDSEYEYYDDEDSIANQKAVIRSDIDADEIQAGSDVDAGEIQAVSDINAGEIQAGSMYADVIKANQMNAQRIIADDVVVSAKYREL
ncbi:Hypothetical predicted protein [Mytilus galloprovincialis]|uniref:Uncharacterized protein n=2 Tax=Mytilus galloprovincialis TaxID=29158 RepID=A0A8B6CP88_MYTGA|nr:Hypothetical predicted protein [Mytilus galloprovincialis]